MSTYVPIASQTLTSTATEIIFSSIPQNYTDLVLVCNVQVTTSTDDINIQFNGDTTSTKYSFNQWFSVGGSQYTSRTDNANKFRVADYMPNGTLYGTIVANIMSYTDQNKFKTTVSRWGNGATATGMDTGLWRSYEPITSIRLTEGSGLALKVGSSFSLYGIAVGNSSAKATGGNIVVTDGSYWYHAFTSSGTFIPNQALTADVLVVAGGGSGGGGIYGGSGGGGAGGLSYQSGRSLSANTAYVTIVGAGGATATGDVQGNNGNNSIFDTITSIGGGGGGHYNLSNTIATAGNAGGSGGGSYDNQSGGASTQTNTGGATGYGNAGGIGRTYVGGGGGGAGAVGGNGAGNGPFDAAGIGGNGLSTWSSWGAATNTGHNVSGTRWYAGGGSGGWQNSASNVGTSNGGGGAGSNGLSTTPGLPNTGGGGGGSERGGTASGGAGGSGIVIIRYAV